jgi:ribosomal protein S19
MVGFKIGEFSITKKFDMHYKKNEKQGVKPNLKNN